MGERIRQRKNIYARPKWRRRRRRRRRKSERERRSASHTSRDRGPRETGGGRQWLQLKEREEENERTPGPAIQTAVLILH
jgi:hypothetical protein